MNNKHILIEKVMTIHRSEEKQVFIRQNENFSAFHSILVNICNERKPTSMWRSKSCLHSPKVITIDLQLQRTVSLDGHRHTQLFRLDTAATLQKPYVWRFIMGKLRNVKKSHQWRISHKIYKQVKQKQWISKSLPIKKRLLRFTEKKS